jgi:hypothetical protein
MTNKKFFVGMAVLLSVSLFVIGCETEAADGVTGPQGSVGTIYLSGPVTTAGINHAIASGAPLVFAGVTQSDRGTVIIPAGKGVELVGATAYTAENNAGSTLVIEDASSVTGSGGLVAGAALAIAPDSVLGDITGANKVPLQSGGDIDLDGGATVAVKVAELTISDEVTSATNIIKTALSGKTLYVVGNVTASAAITPAPTAINVLGNVTVTTAQTAAVVWNIQCDLTATKLPTTGAGTLTVDGSATFAEAVSGITGNVSITGDATFNEAVTTAAGTLTVGGNATFKKTLTTGVGAVTAGSLTVEGTNATSLGGNLTVNGAASFGGTLTNTAASIATFNGTTTVTGAVTTTATLTIGGTGAVTLAGVPVLTNGLTVTNATGVTFSSAFGLTASQSITATTGKVIFGTAPNSVTITNGTLASAAAGLATVAANGVVTLAFSTNSASLALADGGSVAVAGNGKVASPGLEISGAGTTVTSAGASTITAASATTTTLLTTNVADNGIQIGTAANGVALFAVGTDAMTYTFTKSAGTGHEVTIAGAFISAPADSTTGAIIAATTADKAKIVLGTTSGGIKIGKGAHGGQMSITYTSGGSKIGPFAEGSHANGNLPATVGLAATDAQSAGEKILLGAFDSGYSTAGAAVMAFGITGSGDAEINSSLVLEAN